MPPRLSQLVRWSRPNAPSTASTTSFLLPFLQQRCSVSILSSLSDNPTAYNKRIRRGRGPSSGKGKTSGRGHKGQKQHGKVPRGFQGGQTPVEIVKGERGFTNNFSVEMSVLNLDRLQSWIDQDRLDPSKPITLKELVESRCLHGIKDGVKLLGRGADALRTPINIIVSRASASAIEAIEARGGSVTSRFYTRPSIRRILLSQTPTFADQAPDSTSTEPFAYRLPDPTSRRDIEYYRDPAHRGYLSHLVPEGEGPSLFFKVPRKEKDRRKGKMDAPSGKAVTQRSENRLW
ncbi:MAG: YmL10 [Trichoglossum hirsutum]|nr:MAG: YmL10 [Trichoglossum hirsutum]